MPMIVAIVLLTHLAGTASLPAAARESQPSERDAIENLFQVELASAWRNADAARLASLWREDGDWMSIIGSRRVSRGREAIEGVWAVGLQGRDTIESRALTVEIDQIQHLSQNLAQVDLVLAIGIPRTGVTREAMMALVQKEGPDWRIASARVARIPTTVSRATPSEMNALAPKQTGHLARLIGEWQVEQQVRRQDGTWGEHESAEWRWFYALDGHAIQDDWIKPPPGPDAGPERTYGTNLRIYDPREDRWHMVWTDSTSRQVRTFTAVNEGDTVVMHGETADGTPMRNRFFDITTDSFEWVQEWSFDGGSSWTPVSRIRATRKPR